MNVTLLAHTQVSNKFRKLWSDEVAAAWMQDIFTDGQAVAMTAIRTCYSEKKPTQIVNAELLKYLRKAARDGAADNDLNGLIRFIQGSGHTSTLEHVSFTFAIEGVSRALLAQLTRHRVGFSFSVQSQRYVNYEKKGGLEFVTPAALNDGVENALLMQAMERARETYSLLIKLGVKPEDARAVLPNATACNLVMTCNITSLLSFYSKRHEGTGAQDEIKQLAEALRREVEEVEPWLSWAFEKVKGA